MLEGMTRFLPGPQAMLLLAALSAEVIRIGKGAGPSHDVSRLSEPAKLG